MKDFIIPDRDFGTPASKAKEMVTLTKVLGSFMGGGGWNNGRR